MNDDLVQPNRGFGEHPHRDVEICTYVVEGALTHKDSMGTAETLSRGAIQFLTAGTGITHSEHNLGTTPLRFIQIWINTRQRGLRPNYGSATGNPEDRRNKFDHLVSDVASPDVATPIKINADSNILVAEVEAGSRASYSLGDERQAYLICLEGDCRISVVRGTSHLMINSCNVMMLVKSLRVAVI